MPTGPLAVWLVVQLTALALAAERVPLAARYPAAGERLALHVVLVAQVVFSALLFPWLLRDWTAAVLSIALCWPVLALAQALSGLPPTRLLGVAGYMTLWLAALAAWRAALHSQKSQMLGVAIAAGWAIGGPVLWYLRAEFNAPDTEVPPLTARYGPIAGALSQVGGSGADGASGAGFWLVPACLLVSGVTVAWVVRLLSRRRQQHAGVRSI